MQFSVYSQALATAKHELIVMMVGSAETSANIKKFKETLPGSFQSRIKAIESGSFKQNELLFNPLQSDRSSLNQWLLVINVNPANNSSAALDNTQYQEILQSIAKSIQSTKAKSTLLLLDGVTLDNSSKSTISEAFSQTYQQAVSTIEQSFYQFSECKSQTTKSKNAFPSKSTKIQFYSTNKRQQTAIKDAIKVGQSLSAGLSLCKDLGNLPGNICTPSYLAKVAKSLAKDTALKTTVLDEKQMAKLGMRTLLSVSKGSDEPAKFIIMEYQGGKKGDAPIALVGKGLTFDAGGISIKPAAAMDEMKYDMCGGASVFGVMKALTELKPNINVIGIVPSSENLINGKANKPGDIIKSMDGQTIEILNTDAEGRLILADALTYTKRFKPKAIIDIATLTGACIIALGHHMSGLFSNHDELAQSLSDTGKKTGDLAWQLPLHPLYAKQLQSNFADLGNIGGRAAGSVTAAEFLQHFVDENTQWAHLDIAGTAWNSGAAKGATGRPVSLLFNYLLNQSK